MNRFRLIGLPAGILFALFSATPTAAQNVAPQSIGLSSPEVASEVGETRTFTAVFRDPNGYADITNARFTVGSTAAGLNVYYNAAQNKMFLSNDTNSGFVYSDPSTMGNVPGAGNNVIVENKFATLNASASTVVRTGTDVTLTLSITPKATLVKTNNVLLFCGDSKGLSDPWKVFGTWAITSITAATNVAPKNTTVAMSGINQPYAFSTAFRDENGVSDFKTLKIIVTSSEQKPSISTETPSVSKGKALMQSQDESLLLPTPTAPLAVINPIQAHYDPLTNKIFLLNDEGSAFVNPDGDVVGTSVILENSRGAVNLLAMSVLRTDKEITIKWSLTPKPGFSGSKKIFSFSQDGLGASDGWDESAAWIVTP